jgi:hypothetical protein
VLAGYFIFFNNHWVGYFLNFLGVGRLLHFFNNHWVGYFLNFLGVGWLLHFLNNHWVGYFLNFFGGSHNSVFFLGSEFLLFIDKKISKILEEYVFLVV